MQTNRRQNKMNRISGLMNRRDFLKLTATGVATLTLPHIAFSAKSKNKPNVLFIAIDDLNDWIGCLGGHPDVRTPNLDRLARRGVLFTNAHCSAPACNPSRASLMTGILPSTSGVYHNPDPWRKSTALSKAVTIPQHFMAHGYTAVGGTTDVSPTRPRGRNISRPRRRTSPMTRCLRTGR